MKKYLFLTAILLTMNQINVAQEKDPYLWLEEVEDKKALEWVEKWNEKTLDILTAQPGYEKMYQKNLEIYNSTDRIPDPTMYGKYIFNFWQDGKNERGIWRRTTLENYKKKNPEWEVLLDLDALSEKDGVKWVFKGATGLYPDYNRFLLNLSKGGGDAVIIREFDVTTKSFVEDGFYLPEAKGSADWIDQNTLIVSTDFGEGMTTSGYPRQVKIWKRGTDLKNAKLVYESGEENMGIWGYTQHTKNKVYKLITKRTSFYSGSYFFIENGELIEPDIPDDIELSTLFNGKVIFQLKSDWKINGSKNFKQGDVISIDYADLISDRQNYELLLRPDERSSVTGLSSTKDFLLVNKLSNVKGELHAYRYENGWKSHKIKAPDFGNITLAASSQLHNNFYFYFQNFLQPSALYTGSSSKENVQIVKSLPHFFPAEKYKVQQFEAASGDGTKIPYFVVSGKSVKYNGDNPTLLYAYGGFEVPVLPRYSAITGTSWLENGGVYVVANLRGGGEFGPKWHQAVLKENRQKVYDDFIAVAENLITKKITSPKRLGIYGGSNGGLLVGVAYTQRPDLYNAVVCAVPLLDMKRYHKLLAGASWMAEYGNPDKPEEWEYIKKYSPYQNVKKEMVYPEVFFTTSTRDDRVHPGHARKMVAKMDNLGYDVLYYENTEGGHAGASTNKQRARVSALIYTYLQLKLME